MMPAVKAKHLKEIEVNPKFADSEVIAIDEGQFFQDVLPML